MTKKERKEYNQQWYKKNKESEKQKKKEYRLKNKEEISKRRRKNYKNNPDKVKEATKYYRDNNKEKLSEKRKENYKKNRDVLLSRNKLSANKPENKAKRKKYTSAYARLKKNNRETSLPKQLKERTIVPTDSQLQMMEQAITSYRRKFYKYTRNELLTDAYIGLLAAIRTIKPGYDIDNHIRFRVRAELRNAFNRENKKYTLSLSTPSFVSEEFELIDIIEAKNESVDIGIKHEAYHFKKIIKNKFKHIKMTHRNNYSWRMLYNFWYDKEINNLSLSEIMDKYSIITYKATKHLSQRIENIWLEIRQEIIDDNPSAIF